MHTLDDSSTRTHPHARQAGERAQEFRTILSARRAADAILADAAEVRHDAGLQAELLVADAEALSKDIGDQARSLLDRTTGQARGRADGVLADMESVVRALAATLQQARDSVAEAEATIALLRAEISGISSDAGAPHRNQPHKPHEPHEDRVEPRPLGWLFRPERS